MNGVDTLFLDTNILAYAYDRAEPVKGPAAQALIQQIFAAGRPWISTQVLSEFYWTATRRLNPALTHKEAVHEIATFQRLTRIASVDWPLLEKALEYVGLHQLALWDAQILAAASLNAASILLSEDFQHRAFLEGIGILNPFAADFDPAEILKP